MRFRNSVFLILLLLINATLAGNTVIDTYFKFYGDTAKLDWLRVSYGNDSQIIAPAEGNGTYQLEVIYQNSTKVKRKFDIPLAIEYIDPPGKVLKFPLNDTVILQYATKINFVLPFYHHSQIIKISKGNTTIFSSPLTPYLCNSNGKCDVGEDFVSCSADCPSGGADGFCDQKKDSICDPDCNIAFDTDCSDGSKQSTTQNPTIITLADIKNNDTISDNEDGSSKICFPAFFVLFCFIAPFIYGSR